MQEDYCYAEKGDCYCFKCEQNQPSECPECSFVNKLGEDCKKCGHSWGL